MAGFKLFEIHEEGKLRYLNGADAQPVRVISSQDYPHHLVISGIYELPVGTGRKLKPHLRPFWPVS